MKVMETWKTQLVFLTTALLVAACGEVVSEQNPLPVGYIQMDGELQPVSYQEHDDKHALIWGDVLVNKEKIIKESSKATYLSSYTREAYTFYTWPDARVPYELPSNFPTEWKVHWDKMIQEWKRADINWVPKTAADTSFVKVVFEKNYAACATAFMGWQKDQPSIMTVRDPSEFGTCSQILEGLFLHESSHSLTFNHEHQRPDRDLFIKRNPQALLDPIFDPWFEIIKMSHLFTTFDIASATLYSDYYVKLDGSRIPTPTRLSDLDIEGAKRRYHSKIAINTNKIYSSMSSGSKVGDISVTSPVPGPYSLRIIQNYSAIPVELNNNTLVLNSKFARPQPGTYEILLEAKSPIEFSFFHKLDITIAPVGEEPPPANDNPANDNPANDNPTNDNPTNTVNPNPNTSTPTDVMVMNPDNNQTNQNDTGQTDVPDPTETLTSIDKASQTEISSIPAESGDLIKVTAENSDSQEFKAPVWIKLESQISDGQSFKWSFEDGSSADTLTVFKQYVVPGEYSIQHSVTDQDGKPREQSYVIKIK